VSLAKTYLKKKERFLNLKETKMFVQQAFNIFAGHFFKCGLRVGRNKSKGLLRA